MLADGEQHALHGGCGAANHQKGGRSAKGVGRQFLGAFDNRNRVAKVVQRLHRVYVHTDALLA